MATATAHWLHNPQHNTNPNTADSRSLNVALDDTPKYMKATVKEGRYSLPFNLHQSNKPIVVVPLKEEAIALSWPLVEYARRRHSRTPLLHFDVGFDPRIDEWNVRANRGGYSTPITRAEQELSVSTHCILTRMVIRSRVLEQWPIVVEREHGLRCIDVFRAIYNTYHKPLTPAEMATLGENYIERCRPAFQQRCKDSPGLPLYNEQRGMRRVDLLRGRRIFKGLTQSPESGVDWVLHFDGPQR
jgi:hypothetical protein